MGPAGSGKTTIGRRLAEAWGYRFVDADDHHPATNVKKMQAGIGLSDEDRVPWLRALHQILAESPGVVLACSALKRSYRTILCGDLRAVAFVYLRVPADELSRRLESRTGHYAGPALLSGQMATLEEPADEPRAFVVDGVGTEDDVFSRVISALASQN